MLIFVLFSIKRRKFPFVKLMPENKHIEEKQQGKENWNAKDWAEYRHWHAYLTSVDPIFCWQLKSHERLVLKKGTT